MSIFSTDACAYPQSAELFPDVSIIDRLERRMGWAAFPGIIRYLAIFQVLTIVLSWLNPTLIDKLSFQYGAIMSGEVWRIFSFILLPSPSLAASFGGLSAIFTYIMASLLFMFGDGLEREWGSFRTSLYIYCGWAAAAITSMAVGYFAPNAVLYPAVYLNLSIMLAFAVFYPNVELMLMFLIPVKIYLLAILSSLLLVFQIINNYALLPVIVGSLAHFFLFIGPGGIRAAIQRSGNIKRQKEFKKKSLPTDEAFHNCESCGATEHTHPDRDFRVSENNQELCSTCLEGSENS